jgi:hypothetical protein
VHGIELTAAGRAFLDQTLEPASARLPCEGVKLQTQPAEMQTTNWNDLRYILAVSRGKTLAAAVRLLGVDDTTVCSTPSCYAGDDRRAPLSAAG